MADQPIPFSEFGGLNVRDAPDTLASNKAVDLLNVEAGPEGFVKSRVGWANIGSAAADAYTQLYAANTSQYLIAHRGADIVLLDNLGSSVTSYTGSGASRISVVNIGTPSASRSYVAESGSSMRRLAGIASFSAPAGLPTGGSVAVQHPDNRLVSIGPSAGPSAASSSGSHVWFSNAGDPETWRANDYVILSPGDGETAIGGVSWRGSLFVFKNSRMWQFYGNSTDAAGNAVFNNRPVELGTTLTLGGVSGNPGLPFCAGKDGVYFFSQDGLYVTTGDVPTLLSDELRPFTWANQSPLYWAGLPVYFPNCEPHLFEFQDRIYVSFAHNDGSKTRATFVYDTRTGEWTYWDVSANCFAATPYSGSVQTLYFTAADGSKRLRAFNDSTRTTDAGTGITSRYRTGFYDFGDGDQKTIHNVDLWGTGTVAYSTARDFNSTLGTARNVTLGTSPAIGYGRTTPSPDTARGNLFSHQLASVSGGAWSVQRVVQNVQAKRPSGPKGT